ncbi:MAG TPA: 23S rRNA (pseudouridine(1915)-N(3))-methyltransferase RlmH [Candidatus Absconditabacterales bacterium]|nr:23S rRNA (pseudouridine(1915)-N(3))-methyltransferase RlmH [Candidatus Absconditabacterales bacterium]
MKIKLLCVSDSDKHFQSAIDEYLKRLGKDTEIVTIKPEKNGTREQIIMKETQKISDYLEKHFSGWARVLLAKKGKNWSTEDFLHFITKEARIVFVIGGPYGIDEKFLTEKIDAKLALGALTLPHGLAKLVLLEQIYRVAMIQGGREYHY